MGVHLPSVATTTFIGPLPANANETALLTTPVINPSLDNAQIILHWFATLTAGTATTAFAFRIRRGTGITGQTVATGPWTTAVTAGNAAISAGTTVDAPGVVAGQQYTLSIVQTAATGAGTWQDGALVALVL